MKASDLFVKALENEGVEKIFGLPGEETLDLLESIRKSRIELVLTRHEQAAGFMAATYGRLTGKAGVCLATLGPGATNLLTAAAYANLGGMPMLVITGQKPVTRGKQGQFQMIDVVEMMRPIVKYTKQIINADSIPAILREAFRVAEEERPGASHVELPEDISQESTDAKLFEPSFARRPEADDESIAKAVEMIRNAKCPLLLIGAGANRYLISSVLRHFIDETGIPFFNTQMGKGVIDERHPKFIGTAALSAHDYLHCAISYSDLIINVGHDIIEKPPFFMEHGGLKVIHVNYFSAMVDDIYFPQIEVIGDIANSVERLARALGSNPNREQERIDMLKKESEAHIAEKAVDEGFPLIPQRIVGDVRRAMRDDGILTLDNGVYKIWFARNYKAYAHNTILLDNALASMGAGLPSAIAAKMVYPDRQVMAVCGDGGFMMNSQEVETAVRLGINLVVIILRDDAYGMIKWKQTGMGFETFGLDFKNPDFVMYAESYGARGYRVEKTEDFEPLMKDCLESDGVHLIEVPVDYSENERVLLEGLKERTCNF